MARQLTMHVWCDLCLSQDDAYVEGTETPPITIGNTKPRVMALCPVHEKLFTDFKSLLMDLGQMTGDEAPAVKQPTKRKTSLPHQSPLQPPYICKVPGCAATERGHEFKNQGSMGQHIRQEHGLITHEYAVRYLGLVDDPALMDMDVPEEDWRCGVVDVENGKCTTEYPPAEYPGQHRRLVRLHRARAHGIRSDKKK